MNLKSLAIAICLLGVAVASQATLRFGENFPAQAMNLLTMEVDALRTSAYSFGGRQFGSFDQGVDIEAFVSLVKDQVGSGGTLSVGADLNGDKFLDASELHVTRLQTVNWPDTGSMLRVQVLNEGTFVAVDGEAFYGAFPGGRPTNSSSTFIVVNDDVTDFSANWRANLFVGEFDGNVHFTVDINLAGASVATIPESSTAMQLILGGLLIGSYFIRHQAAAMRKQ